MKEQIMKFPLSISTTSYEGKCNEWGKLQYQNQEINIDQLEGYVRNGYCFTHTFKGAKDQIFSVKEKTIKNFDSTNTVFMDVDNSKISAPDFYTTVSIKPSMLYTTPSNIIGVKNSYRLIYIFEEPIISNNSYKILINSIASELSSELTDFKIDTSCFNASQQMGGNGNSSDIVLYKTYNIFSFSDFNKNYITNFNYLNTNNELIKSGNPDEYIKKRRNDIPNGNADNPEFFTNPEFETDFWNIKNSNLALAFFSKYGFMYPIIESTPVDELEPYIKLDENYIEIRRRYHKEMINGKWVAIPVKIKEGSRERILFTNAILRLKMKPDMIFEHLLFSLVYERQYYINNNDRSITNKVLYKIAKGAFLDHEKYQQIDLNRTYVKKNKSGYKVNPAFCISQGLSARSIANTIRSTISTKILQEHYNFEKSVKENSLLLKEMGIKPNSQRTLYKFIKSQSV